MINNHLNCESFEPLISAMIDGELDSSERNELNSHLQNCALCKKRVASFEQVDAAVETLSHDFVGAGALVSTARHSLAAPPFAMYPPTMTSRRKNNRLIWRLIPIAAVASLLICLGIVIWPNQPVGAEQISPAQIVKPMQELHSLNVRKRRDQDVMLKTLGLDLRSMKLEINLLEPDSKERVSLTAQIDAMLEKVRLYEADYLAEAD